MSAFERGWAQPSNGWCFTVNDDPTALSGVVFCDLLSGEQRCHGRGARERFQAHEVGARRRLLASSNRSDEMRQVLTSASAIGTLPSRGARPVGSSCLLYQVTTPIYRAYFVVFSFTFLSASVLLSVEFKTPTWRPPGCTRSSLCQTCPFQFRSALHQEG